MLGTLLAKDLRRARRNPLPWLINLAMPLCITALIGLAFGSRSDRGALGRIRSVWWMRAHALTPGELILGKIYGLTLLGAVQTLFFLAVGKFVFGVNLGANLPAVALTLLVFGWVAGSFGVLVGSVVSADDRVVGIGVLASLLMAALGGCWWPLEVAPPALKVVALCLPTGWALQALHQLISFGSGFAAVGTPLAVLFGFGAAANLLAARFFRS